MNDPLGLFEEQGNADPLGLFTEDTPKKKASLGTAIHLANEQAANALDRFGTGLAGGVVNLFDTDKADEIFSKLDKRTAERLRAANPNNDEVGLGGKVAGAVATLPVQMAAMFASPADTGQTMIQEGETLPRALAGTAIDSVGNAVGLAIPGGFGGTLVKKALTGAGANAAQDVLTKQAIAAVAQQDRTKEILGPNRDSAIVSAILGGAMGPMTPSRPQAQPAVKLPDAPVRPEAPVTPLEASRQLDLPFSDSVETIAARQAEANPQLDMFVEANRPRDPYAEAQAKQQALENLPVDRPDPAAVQQEMEAMWNQRQEQVKQADPELVQRIRQERIDEAKAAKEDLLMQMEEELRSNAYDSPDYQSVRQKRGRVPRKQAGRIDIGNDLDTIKNKFQKFDVEVEPIKLGSANSVMVRLKTPDGKLSGFVDFAIREDGTLVAENAQVADGLRGHGAAARMYLAAREAGFDIAPGRVQTDLGKKMVASLQRKGIINKEAAGPRFDAGNLNLMPLEGEQLPGYGNRPISVPASQRGAVDFQGVSESLKNIFKGKVVQNTRGPVTDIVGKSMIPVDPAPADVITKALAEGKDASVSKAATLTASGGNLEALTRRSALVDGVVKTVQNAVKRADLLTTKTIVPVEKQLRKLPTKDIVNMAEVFKWEMFNRQQMTAEQLQATGLNEKALAAYAGVRQMFKDTLDIQNQARAQQGLDPISAKEYYTASRWQGDFRQPVYDKEGRLKWYLAADSKLGLNEQVKALKKEFPELVVDPKKSHVVRSGMTKNDLQAQYSTLLDVLGRDNPEVIRLKEALESAVATETSNFAGQQKHFESKGNIRGFVGDRPGMPSNKEALAMFNEQIQYAKNAYKWSSMQEAGAKLKEVFSDEALNTQQPKNMEYAKAYYQNNAGSNTAKWVAGIENAVRDLGVSPSVFGRGVGNLKSFFIVQKLALSLGYTAANFLQVVNTVPHLMDGMVKLGGNPIKGLGLGMAMGLPMALGHYANSMKQLVDTVPTKDLGFYKQAFKYAEDNGITARSILDESPVTSRGAVAESVKLLGKTMSVPEAIVRSTAYMTFVNMLKDTGKFKDNTALFQKAEELVNASMVDYRAGERPMVFSKLGTIGDALNTLQTYPANLLNQYRYFGKEALRGNPLPLLSMMVVQMGMAGLSGVPGFNDLDKLINWAKGMLPDAAWEKVKDFDLKLWALEHLGEGAVYGAVSSESGINMTGRLSAPGLGDMAVSPAAPLVDVAKQVGAVGKAVVDPTSTNVAQAVRNVTPTGLQGLMETEVFRDQNVSRDRPDGTAVYKRATDLASREGVYARTPEEEAMRAAGLRSQREAFTSDINYKIGKQQKDVVDRSKGIVDKYYDAIRRGDTKRAENLQALYVRLNGTAIENQQLETQMKQEFLTAIERSTTTAKKLEAVKGMARLNKLIEERDAE
jgi:hypothetical protein